MKYWLAVVLALGLLSRLPHPSKDIADLNPVQTVYLYMEGDTLCMETDTGDSGAGVDLTAAAEDLKYGADGEVYLDTAEFLILQPNVPVTDQFHKLLRPDCRVIYTTAVPDMETISRYLSVHTPPVTLAQLAGAAE